VLLLSPLLLLLLQVPFATHTACTIEIANLTVDYDVAVIDEVQVLFIQQYHN
jgi:hypothetical protein